MDSALILRMEFERGKQSENISERLENSPLVGRLTEESLENPLSVCFRLQGLSEIPYSQTLSYTQNLLTFANEKMVTGEGFSCLGGIKEIVPCYNAMMLEVYSRMGLADSKEAQGALDWITHYQLFDRNQKTTWKYDGICKHGGCLGKTPCYIGIGKTVRALITYLEFAKEPNQAIEELVEQGTTYMLRHKMYQRLSTGKPISAHILDIMMPQNYALSLTDLIYIVGKRGLTKKKEVMPLLQVLSDKQTAPNEWKIDYIYKYKGYVGFETRRKPSEWISNLFPIWLQE